MNNPNSPAKDPVAKAVQDSGNSKLVGAKELLKEKLLGAVLQQAINELGEPATIARSIMGNRGGDLGSIVAASKVLKELVIAEIESRARQNFTDPVVVATELFRSVSDEGQVVESISNELRAMILATASRSAQSSVGDAGAVANELLQGDLIDPSLIEGIKDSLRSKMLSEAADRSNGSLSDVDSAAREVLASMGEDPEAIVDLSGRVRELILTEVERRANASIEDRTESAAKVWQRIGSDNDAVRAVVDKVHDQLIGDIASRSRQTLSDVEGTADIARNLIGENAEGVISASKRLEEILIREIVKSGERALSDTTSAVKLALEEIRPSKEDLAKIQEGLKSKILSDVLARAIKEINEEVSATAADLWLVEGNAAAEASANISRTIDQQPQDRPGVPLGELAPTDQEASVIVSEKEAEQVSSDASERADSTPSNSIVPMTVETGWQSLAAVSEAAESTASSNADHQDDAMVESLGTADIAEDSGPSGKLTDNIESQADGTADLAHDVSEADPTSTELKNESIAEIAAGDTPKAVAGDDSEGIRELAKSWPESATDQSGVEASNKNTGAEFTTSTDSFDVGELLEASEPRATDVIPSTTSVDGFIDDATWYSIQVQESPEDENAGSESSIPSAKTNDTASAAGSGPELDEEAIKALESEQPKPAEALGLLAGWRRKRKTWKVDEVDFSTPTPAIESKTEDSPIESSVMSSGDAVDVHTSRPGAGSESAGADNPATTDREPVAFSDEYANKESWTVSILRDSGKLASRVRESDKVIEDSLGQISQGVVTFVKEEMHRLDGLGSSEAAELMCEHCVQRTHTALSDRTLENRRKEVASSPVEDADVIFVASYLVPSGEGQTVQDEVSRLSAEFEDLGFSLVLDGPFSGQEFAKDGPSSAVENLVA